MKITPAKDITYASYIGGASKDDLNDIAIDNNNYLYLTGETYSIADFPTTNGAIDTYQEGNSACFVVKLDLNSTNLHYSTFVGVLFHLSAVHLDFYFV